MTKEPLLGLSALFEEFNVDGYKSTRRGAHFYGGKKPGKAPCDFGDFGSTLKSFLGV